MGRTASAARRFALTLLVLAVTAVPAVAASPGKVSFTQAQQYFMCTVCGEGLNVARSPEAFNENAELRRLIKHGDTIAQIKRGMVANYGEGVLADPPKHGFAVLLVVIPAAVLVVGLLTLLITIPRWRRRAAAGGELSASDAPSLSEVDADRLDAELARQR